MDTHSTTQNQGRVMVKREKKFSSFGLTVFVITLVVVAGGWYIDYSSQSQSATEQITIDGKTWQSIGKATNDESRERGLSHRPSLERGTGMLFVFDTPGKYGFWMKDMQFPIDIIFIHEGVVDAVARDRSPGDLSPVFPATVADQVFEVNAGEAEDIQPGDRVVLEVY